MPSDERKGRRRSLLLQNVMGVNVQGNHVGFAWYKCKLYSKNTDIDIDMYVYVYTYSMSVYIYIYVYCVYVYKYIRIHMYIYIYVSLLLFCRHITR